MSYHINASGDPGLCKAALKCPFGDKSNHYSSAEAARSAYEKNALVIEESGQIWPPIGLPKKLIFVASLSDLIRHHNDETYGGGEGVCLGASAFISYKLQAQSVRHKLVRGEYTDSSGAKKDHWWVESQNWIIDASRGQFSEPSFKSGVVRAGHASYSTVETFEPGHTSIELVGAELQRCFGDPSEADLYLDEISGIDGEAQELFPESDESINYTLR